MRGSASRTFARTFVQHVGVGAIVLVAVASVAVLVSAKVGRDHTRRQPVAAGELMATRVVAPFVTQGVYQGATTDRGALDARVRIFRVSSPIEDVKVWSGDGVILYSFDPRLIGQRYPLDPAASRAVTSQGVETTVADLSRSHIVLDRRLGESVQVFVGTRDANGRPIVVETYFAVDRLGADEAALTRRMEAVVLVSVLALGLLLVPLAYSLARRMSRVSGPSDAPGSADDTR